MRIQLIKKIGLHFLVIVICVLVSFPFVWMVFTSLKSYPEIYRYPITYFPEKIFWGHYISIFRNSHLQVYILNSIIVSIGAAGLTLAISLLPAYALSRLDFSGKNLLLSSIIICIMFPQLVLVIPFFKILIKIHLIDTYLGLIIVYLPLSTPVAVWFLVSFFAKIPRQLEEAARIDGCGTWRVFASVVLPLIRPGIIAVSIYSFFLAWNEFMFALSYVNSPRVLTLPVFLGRFVGQYQTRWGELFAGSVVACIIPMIAFAVLQKQFAAAFTEGAIKG